MPLQRFPLPDVSGGLNEGQPAVEIADREFTVLDNFFPFGRKLIRRNGTHRLDSSAAAEPITGIFVLHNASGAATTIVAGATKMQRLDAGSFSDLTNIDVVALAADDRPWTMLQYKNVGYAMRPQSGLRRFTENSHAAAGITEPSTAPTLAEGAAGALTAGAYSGVVVFVNRSTGMRSNPSPVSTAVTIAASKQINWTSIPVSSDPFVDGRELYRTLPNSSGIYLFVAEIADNSTTTYTDNVALADLGDDASFDNGRPPVTFVAGDIWNERLFATDGIDVYASEPFMPEAFSGDKIRVFPDDGHRIRAIHADGSRLIIGKTNKIHYLTAAGDDFALATLSDKHGVYSQQSMKSGEGLLLWYGGDSFYRAFGGGSPESIATVKIKDTLAQIPDARKEYVVSAIYPKYGWYISAVTVGSGSTNNKILCYNYKADVWNTFTIGSGNSFAALAEVFDSAYGQILYASRYDNKLFQFDRGLLDDGEVMTAIFRTKAHRLNTMGLLSCMRRFFIHCTKVAASATFSAYANEGASAQATRTVSLYQDGAIKGVNLSTFDQAAASWQLEMSYAAEPVIEIEGLAIEAASLNRRAKVL